jgi:hypothetical protein
MYDALVALLGGPTLWAATVEPEDPESGGTLTITPDDDSNEGNSGGGSSDDD